MGPGDLGFDAWCEACQLAQPIAAAPGAHTRCSRCGTQLFAAPRFVELWGMLQQLDAVLAAWAGDASKLAVLIPRRPEFLTDLTPPPAREDDPGPLRALLTAVARGDWSAAEAPSTASGPRADAARAIAFERLGQLDLAFACWTKVVTAGADTRARLARGSLLARAGQHPAAEADLWAAGDSYPARWNRASWLVHAAVREDAGANSAMLLARARAEAGEPSAFWSDLTVGRLLWSLLAAHAASQGPGEEERARLRAAESQLEHDTFWDRSLMLVGWVQAGAREKAERIAAPLARAEATALANEPALSAGPALAGAPLRDVSRAVTDALEALDAREPARARQAIAGALSRDDLRRFRLPCAACGRGTIGVDEVLEAIEPER